MRVSEIQNRLGQEGLGATLAESFEAAVERTFSRVRSPMSFGIVELTIQGSRDEEVRALFGGTRPGERYCVVGSSPQVLERNLFMFLTGLVVDSK